MKPDKPTGNADSLENKASASAPKTNLTIEQPTLKSGESYTVSDLLNGEHILRIPDMQRDYCWGNLSESGESYAASFLRSLLELFDRKGRGGNTEVPLLGLLYGYEEEPGRGLIFLSDGQQRLTTLFLLLGWLNRVTGGGHFKKELTLSDGETPRLQYEVRESSHYFIAALTKHYFLQAGNKEDEPKAAICGGENTLSADWYFADYPDDPTVQSCIATLECLQAELAGREPEELKEIGKFVCNQLRFIYVDMGGLAQGEETFVVINTTGEPLDTSENLKPRIIANNPDIENVAHSWEKMEAWCWRQKGKLWEEKGMLDTAKPFFTEILRWTAILHADSKETCAAAVQAEIFSFPVKDISFDKVENTFRAVRALSEINRPLYDGACASKDIYPFFVRADQLTENRLHFSQIECFRLLPVLAYLIKHPKAVQQGEANRNLLRLVRFFDNLAQTSRIAHKPADFLFAAIQTAKACNPDVLDLLKSDKEDVQKLINGEERLKLEILQKVGEQGRAATEEAFWALQNTDVVPSHQIWSGEIETVINWSGGREAFDLKAFCDYTARLDALFINDCTEDIDLLRRALLTCKLPYYPLNDHILGWEWEEWKEIMEENGKAFAKVLKTIPVAAAADGEKVNNKAWAKPICERLQQMCDNYATDARLADLVKDDRLLKYCDQKHVFYHQQQKDWMLCQSQWSRPIGLRNLALFDALAPDAKGDVKEAHENGCEYGEHQEWHIHLWAEANSYGGVTIKNDTRKVQIVMSHYIDGCSVILERTDGADREDWPEGSVRGMKWSDDNYKGKATIDYTKDDPYKAVRNLISRIIRWIDCWPIA